MSYQGLAVVSRIRLWRTRLKQRASEFVCRCDDAVAVAEDVDRCRRPVNLIPQFRELRQHGRVFPRILRVDRVSEFAGVVAILLRGGDEASERRDLHVLRMRLCLRLVSESRFPGREPKELALDELPRPGDLERASPWPVGPRSAASRWTLLKMCRELRPTDADASGVSELRAGSLFGAIRPLLVTRSS
jgi:hypothetical protein